MNTKEENTQYSTSNSFPSDNPTELFMIDEIIRWQAEWQNMPEYSIEDLSPKFQLIINFSCAADVDDFCQIIGQSVKAKTGKQRQSLWYPEQDIGRIVNKRYIDRSSNDESNVSNLHSNERAS